VGNMAFLLLGEQRWDQCRPFLERYVALCCGLEDRLGQAQGHLALGRAARALGELTAAAASFDSSLHAAQACGDQALFNDAKVLPRVRLCIVWAGGCARQKEYNQCGCPYATAGEAPV
jgi:hypothetical protein